MPLGSIVSGLIGAGGASAAGAFANRAGQDTGAKVLDESYDVGSRDVGRLSPYISTGLGAENQLSQLYGLGTIAPIGDKWGTFGTTPDTTGQAQKNAMARFQSKPAEPASATM